MTTLDSSKIEIIHRIIRDTSELNGIDIYAISEDKVDDIIKEGLRRALIDVNEDDYKRIKNEFEYRYNITQKEGISIVDDYYEHRDWYLNKCEKDGFINDVFWKRYREYLIREAKLNINIVNNLDNHILRDLMNYLGDPCSESPFFRRGLVIGDVQSGKTATYTGLICKAADSGYKVVILLTGITESLRSQTQKRIESGIIGISITGLKDKKQSKIITRVGVGKDNGPIKVTAMTSMEYDFIGSKDQITTSLENHKLVMFIVKKNTKVLDKLYYWLHSMNANSLDSKIHYPMLLIDDEADNASINTNKEEDDPTKTNEIIRKLANVFTQTTYVGFTATPFANVFINPDTKEEMLNDDLFPKNFIYVLQPPSNYIGPSQIFSKNGKHRDSLVWIQDIEEPEEPDNTFDITNNFYFKHKKEWCGELPKSLFTSIYSFFLANVVRDLRGDSLEPRTMMVNMSRFVKVQAYIKGKIESLYNEVYNEIKINFSDNEDDNVNNKLYKDLKNCWDENFRNINIKWDDVCKKQNLLRAIENIEIIIVNSGKNSGKLDYEKNPHLRAIAIGGLALSRGLTLEGLIISYFYRNTATFDVLMQMGRWFGYRKNYEDLFRIWTSKKSADWYNEIADATDELKSDISRMKDAKLTPADFGLRVRDDSEDLKITAANKMRYADNKIEQISFWGEVFDTPYLDIDLANNISNTNKTIRFINSLVNKGFQFNKPQEGQGLFFNRDISSKNIINFLKELSISVHNIRFDKKQITDFVTNCKDETLEKWDIVIIEGSGDTFEINPKMSIKPVLRGFDTLKNRINIGKRRSRLTSPTDTRNGATKEQIEYTKGEARKNGWDGISTLPRETWFRYIEERNPLLMIYFIYLDTEGCPINEQQLVVDLKGIPLVGFSIGFPKSKNSYASEYHKYKVNIIYNRQEAEEEIAESYEE